MNWIKIFKEDTLMKFIEKVFPELAGQTWPVVAITHLYFCVDGKKEKK